MGMRVFTAGLIASAGMVAATVFTSGAASAAQPHNHGYSAYVQIAVSGQSQCAKPVAQRTGRWMCLAGQQAQVRSYRAYRAARPAMAPADTGGTCTAQGCWDVYSTTDSDFFTTGYYGFGGTPLGSAEMYYEVKLNGAQSISKPVQFTATTAVSSLVFEGERLYYSPAHPEGNGVNGGASMSFTAPKPYAAGVTAQWLPNGYKAYENTVHVGGVVHQWTWTLYDYPGSWYLFAKSVKFDRHPSSAVIYQFGSPTYLGKDPVGAGWQPY
jgi:hypothetical protein